MKTLLGTLYIFTEDAYLSLDHDNVLVESKHKKIGQVPLCSIEQIISFSYAGASPQLMAKCCKHNVGLSFYTPQGKFLIQILEPMVGNILLRRKQFAMYDNNEVTLNISKHFILGKAYNTRWILDRTIRDHKLSVNIDKIQTSINFIKSSFSDIQSALNLDELRGIEGNIATAYFSVFNEMILKHKDYFYFANRNKRPPTDPVNSMLSFFYTLQTNDCANALISVGLDPYAGFMHKDKAGRKSLACDLVEEFRAYMVDRFVLTEINNSRILPKHFKILPNHEVLLTDEGRKILLKDWADKRKEIITHPYLKEKIPKGLLPHVQALLLAKFVRGEYEDYPVFLWK